MPIQHDCAQHGEEWERLRMGIPTSSEFANIFTPIEMKRSKSWKKYARRLIAERLLRMPLPRYSNDSMERGQIREAEAVDWYELDHDLETRKVGIVTDHAPNWQQDDKATGSMGCSPDRLVGDDGLLEVKCPDKPEIQVAYVLEDVHAHREYRSQLQGQLMITEREWVDILCWHDRLPKTVVRVYRDERFIALLRAEIHWVNEQIEADIDKIKTGGYVHVPQAKAALKDMLRASLEASP